MPNCRMSGTAVILALHDAGIHNANSVDYLSEDGFDALRRIVEPKALVWACLEMLEKCEFSPEDKERLEHYLGTLPRSL